MKRLLVLLTMLVAGCSGCQKMEVQPEVVKNLDTANADLATIKQLAQGIVDKCDSAPAGLDSSGVASVRSDAVAIGPRVTSAAAGVASGKVHNESDDKTIARLDSAQGKWDRIWRVVGVIGIALVAFWLVGQFAGDKIGLLGRLGISVATTPLGNVALGAGLAVAPWVFAVAALGFLALWGVNVARKMKGGLRFWAALWEAF